MTNDHSTTPPQRVFWMSACHQIACDAHVPPIASAEWWAGQWHVLGVDEQRGYEGVRGEPARCLACRAIEDRAARSAR